MITTRCSLVLAVLLLIGWTLSFQGTAQEKSPASSSTLRVWRDNTGREILATLKGFKDEDTLILHLEDGRSLPFPVAKLSNADQSFARKAYGQQGKGGSGSANVDWENPKSSEKYVIRSVRRKNAPGYVFMKDGGWKYAVKSIEAKVQFKGKDASALGNVSAYFYDREGKLIDQFNEPPRRQGEDQKYIDAPKTYKKNQLVEHYFPLSPFLIESDWETVLITFGADSDYAVKAMPGTSLEKLVFDEKEYLFPNWTPDASEEKNEQGAMSNVQLEIRRFNKETYPLAMIFDGGYQEGKPCITAEIRANGSISPGKGTVKLYVFDESGKLAASRQTPSSAETKQAGAYVGIPQIANDSWHPVFFALDGDLKLIKYPTYLIVFQFSGKTTASIKSSVGATIEKLDFPEKDDIKP